MATEKKITSRIQQKHDVAANWAKATNFIPKKGEIIIYDAEYNASGEETQAVRFKIGDGSKTVNNLPFAVIDGIQKISGEFYFLKTEDGSIVGINDRGVMIMSKPNNPGLFIVGKDGDMDLYAALMVQSSGDVTSPSTITIGLGEPTVVQLEGQEAGSAKQVFTSQGDGATPKWTSVVNSLNGNTGDITGIATTSQLDNKQNKITSSNKLSSSLVDGLGAAAAKAVDTAITANSTSTNLPTSKAVEDRINAHSGIDKVGTVTGVKMNGTTKNPSSGVVDLGTVITAHQSIKSINTNNTAAQDPNASEAIVGSGTINLHKVAKTGSYNDLLYTPTIPAAANNGTLTIQKNGTKVQTFTANQSSSVTANITVPTKVSELTNDSGYTTNKGTVTSVAVKMNGSEKGKVTSSGTIDLGTVLTNASEFATSAQGTKADNAMPKSGGIFKGNVTIASEHHLKTDLIKSADDSKWIAEITTNGLEIGGSGTPLRFYSSARPVVANQNKELAYTSDIPIKSATLLGTTLYLTL